MTVNTTKITSGPYIGNDVADTFSYTFRVEDKTQLKVFETTDTGVETELVVDTDYTVNTVGDDDGGTITRVAGALPLNYEWYIRSDYKETQLVDLESQGGFFPDVHESVFDKLTFLIQQLLDKIGRTLRFSDSYSGDADPTLPDPEPHKYFRWNDDATAIENVEGILVQPDNIFSNVEAMKVSSNVVAGNLVQTKGYYQPGDGGGATYLIVNLGSYSGTPDGWGDHIVSGSYVAVLQRNGSLYMKNFGAVGDGVADDTAPIQALFNSVNDYETIHGEGYKYRVQATASNIIKPNDDNEIDYGLFVIKGKNNVEVENCVFLYSHVDWGLPVRVALLFLEDSEDCIIDKIEIDNEFVVTEEYVDNSKYFGVWIHNSRRCKLLNSYIHHMDGICFSMTGFGDANNITVPTTSWGHTISGNVFNYFQQNSTKGTGSYGFTVSNNIFKNSWESCFKVSEQYSAVGFEKTNFAQLFTGNVCYWDKDFIAPLNFLGQPHNQHGLMIQGHTFSILVEGNDIDTSNIQYTNLVTSPIRLLTREPTSSDFVMDTVSIKGNTLISKDLLMYINTAFSKNLDISNNTMNGLRMGWFGTGSIPPARNSKLSFNNNFWTRPTGSVDLTFFLNQRSLYEVFEVTNNSFPDNTEIKLEFFNANEFNVCGNVGRIVLIVTDGNNINTKICNNELRAAQITMSSSTYHVDNNVIRSDYTHPILLEFQTETYGSVSHNAIYGDTSELANGFLGINLTSGQSSRVLLESNAVYANLVRGYDLGTGVRVRAGNLVIDDNDPNGRVAADKGVTCLTPNNASIDAQFWYKTSNSGASDWEPLLLAPQVP